MPRKQPACRQRGGQKPAQAVGQGGTCRPCPCLSCAKPRHDDNAICPRNQCQHTRQIIGIGRHGGCRGHQAGGGCGQCRGPVQHRVLQVEGNANNHRAPRHPRLEEGIAQPLGQTGRMMQRAVGRPCRCDKGGLIDHLVIPCRFQRRLARQHHQRDACAHRRRQRRGQLRQPRPTGDSGKAHAARLARMRHGSGHRAMLVADIDHRATRLGEARGEIHVGVAQKRETNAGVFLCGHIGQQVEGVQPHRGPYPCNRPGGTMTSPRAIMRAVRTSPADFITKPASVWS